ncbi:MAG TPA: PhoU domain-containing protein, partial [Roseateles sp.]|nr:PhoU domain-containing protein [Roseateles sp.]
MSSTQPHEHIVKSYDEEQRAVSEEILRMGEIAVAQLEAALDVVERRDDHAARRIIANDEAIDAVAKRDSDLATEVIEGDARVDALERDVESLVVRLLALRQP